MQIHARYELKEKEALSFDNVFSLSLSSNICLNKYSTWTRVIAWLFSEIVTQKSRLVSRPMYFYRRPIKYPFRLAIVKHQ